MHSWEEWNQSFKKSPYTNSDWEPDFNNYSYAFLDWGGKPSTGFEIKFKNITFHNNNIEFHYSKESPQGFTMAIVTFEQQMVRIDRTQFVGHPVDSYEFILDSST